MLRYSVSSGQSSAIGEIVVQPVPASTSSQPPVVPNVEVDVRTGGVVTIPVLDGAFDPDGDRPTLDPGAGRAARARARACCSCPVTCCGTRRRRPAHGPRDVLRPGRHGQRHGGHRHGAGARVRRQHQAAAAAARPHGPRVRGRQGPDRGPARRDRRRRRRRDAARASRRRRRTAGSPRSDRTGSSTRPCPDELDTDEFTYAVEDWTGQRAVAKIRVGISPRPTGAAPVTARDDQVTVKPGPAGRGACPGQRRRLQRWRPHARPAPRHGRRAPDAQVDGRRIIVHAPDTPTVLQIGYAVENDRGGRDSAVLTVTVATDAPVAAADRS